MKVNSNFYYVVLMLLVVMTFVYVKRVADRYTPQ